MKYRMITMAVVMGLAACSSGGSGSSISNNQPNTQPNNPTSSISPTVKTQDSLRNGAIIIWFMLILLPQSILSIH